MRAAGLLELFMALASGYEVEVWEDLSSHILRCAECRDAFGFLPSFPWAPLVAQMVKNLLAMQETHVRSLDRDDPWRRAWQPTPVFLFKLKFGSVGKESTCNGGDLGLIPQLGRSPGEGKGYTLQYSGLEKIPWTV